MQAPRPLDLSESDHRRLLRAAARLIGASEAEDVVQDAYLRALEHAGPAPDVPLAWLQTVVRHAAVDRLRRERWWRDWLAGQSPDRSLPRAPSAESTAALAQETGQVLRRIAARLTPAEGAALLLYALFEATHAELAEAGGRSEAASRQQLRRALTKLREESSRSSPDTESAEDAVFRVQAEALLRRDPGALWAMLRQAPITASAPESARPPLSSAPRTTASGVTQVGGQLGLVLTLDGVTLCVLPLGVRGEVEPAMG